MAASALFFILFALWMIGGTAWSIVKILTGNFKVGEEVLRPSYDLGWSGARLGVTMPDGGEPVTEKKEKKES